MTMLQQILETMHIDKELLVELPDDLKQVLFYKMRQEQVRRWMEYDTKWETGELRPDDESRIIKRKSRKVEILLDERGSPWTWVMDEITPNGKITEEMWSSSFSKVMASIDSSVIQDTSLKDNNGLSNSISPEIKIEQRVPVVSPTSEKVIESSDSVVPLDIMRLKTSEEEAVAESLWKEQEEKAKKAEMEARIRARQARSRQLTAKDIDVIMAHYRQNQKSLWTEFSERPQNRSDVVRWFRRRELQRRSITDEYGCIPVWFHGLIGRNDAEQLLANENVAIGSFLVRLNERIWGYAVSYKHTSGFKHFLIAALDDCYQVVGQNQPSFKTLVELVAYYKSRPISYENGELLLKPVPRGDSSGLHELFDLNTDSSA